MEDVKTDDETLLEEDDEYTKKFHHLQKNGVCGCSRDYLELPFDGDNPPCPLPREIRR